MIDQPKPIPDCANLSNSAGMDCIEPIHLLVEAALIHSEIRYVVLSDGSTSGVYDFYLPSFGVILAIERTPDKAMYEAMAQCADIILVQGDKSIKFIVAFLVAQGGPEIMERPRSV